MGAPLLRQIRLMDIGVLDEIEETPVRLILARRAPFCLLVGSYS
jgi:hypothetical protein